MTHHGKAALHRLTLRRTEKVGDTGVTLGSIIDYVTSLEGEVERLHAAATGFDRIVAARKAHVDAVSAYNARRALAQSERARGNWSIKLDAEYRTMSDAQSEFIRVAQEVADAALSTSGKE
ncbi:hypothetical protein [Shinella sp.]|jgi:hypothetical protein|uniref:hypothetical protein n=1 Tax=Shinella sp. TaxID=1870904 RepID=UPI003F716113